MRSEIYLPPRGVCCKIYEDPGKVYTKVGEFKIENCC